MTDRSARRRTTRWTTGPPLIVGRVVLWLLLWRSVEPLTVVTGVVVALVVVRVFRLPPVPHVGRFHPLAALSLAGWFAVQVVTASVEVAGQAFAALGPEYLFSDPEAITRLMRRPELV
jgi:multicomponent Na+:H+ antiporter subunit E